MIYSKSKISVNVLDSGDVIDTSSLFIASHEAKDSDDMTFITFLIMIC